MNRTNYAFRDQVLTAILLQTADPAPPHNDLFSYSDGELDDFRRLFLELFDRNLYGLPLHQTEVRSQLESALAEHPVDLASLKGMHDTGGGPALTEVRGSLLFFDECVPKLPEPRKGFSYFEGQQYAELLGPHVEMIYPERYLRLGNELQVPLDRGSGDIFLNTSRNPQKLAKGRVFTGNGSNYYCGGGGGYGIGGGTSLPRNNTETPIRLGEGNPRGQESTRGLRFSLTMG